MLNSDANNVSFVPRLAFRRVRVLISVFLQELRYEQLAAKL